MPKVKIKSVSPGGYWIVDYAAHRKAIDEHKKKSGWVEPDDIKKMQAAGIAVPPQMLVDPILPQKQGKFIPADETELDLADEEYEMLKGDPNVVMLSGQQSDLTAEDKKRIERQKKAEQQFGGSHGGENKG